MTVFQCALPPYILALHSFQKGTLKSHPNRTHDFPYQQ